MNDIEVSSIDLVEGGNVFKQGHYLTLGYVPRDEKGETVDLSGKTLNVALWSRKGVAFEAAATFSGGVIRFTLDKVVAAGDYTVEFTATSSTDAKYRKKFPTNQHSGRIAIKQSADDLGVVGIQVYTVAQLKAEQKALLDAAVSGFTVDSETKMARVSGSTTYTSLPARLEADKQATAAQLADKADKEQLNALAGGAPKLIVQSVANLPSTVTETSEKLALVLDDGHKYYHNGTSWVDAGVYQAVKLDTVNQEKLDKSVASIGFKNYGIGGSPTGDDRVYYTFSLANGNTDTVLKEVTFTPSARLGQVNYSGFRNSGLTLLNNIAYVTLKIKHSGATTKDSLKAQLRLNGGTSNLLSITGVTNQYKTFTLLFDRSLYEIHATSVLRIYDDAASGWDTISIKDITVANITEVFGYGNEPSKSFLDGLNVPYVKPLAISNTNIVQEALHARTADSINGAEEFSKPIYVEIENEAITAVSKYSETLDLAVSMGKRGINNIFEFVEFSTIPNTTKKTTDSLVSKTIIRSVGSDWRGPLIVRAANNVDGDDPTKKNFTGGNHGYDNTGTISGNSPTGRTTAITFFVEGRKVTSFQGYTGSLDIYWTNYIQAYNTRKVDGSGREVLKENYHLHFDGYEWKQENIIELLEDVVMERYHGIQAENGPWGGLVLFHSTVNRKWNDATIATTSIDKPCDMISMFSGIHALEMKLNVNNGLGKREFLTEVGYGAHASSSKKYFHVLHGEHPFSAGDVLTQQGGYRFYSK